MNTTRTRVDQRRTEQRNRTSMNLDHMSPLEIVRLMNREDHEVAPAVALELPAIANAVNGILDRMRKGGRLIYVGAGTSGRLGVLDASECPPTFGVSPGLVIGLIAGGKRAVTQPIEGGEDSTAAARRDLAKIRLAKNDSLVGLAASGSTPYVLAAITYANAAERLPLRLPPTGNRRSPDLQR